MYEEIFATCCLAALLLSTSRSDKFALVDPFIGTDFNGHTFPGATVPHGLIQPRPATGDDKIGLSGQKVSSGPLFNATPNDKIRLPGQIVLSPGRDCRLTRPAAGQNRPPTPRKKAGA